ncbi:hypothetical protein QBC42DRAFT_297733 [Cladorrhinum samala]|uniref:Uncharacterized protein n=1 Tax=Cladorrhinum samala TaxID=585594 RepID=A0AAV9HL52_9PEZI|nr:hypothetical protein QBC42DRAFT_297733 [Cladorrhinum samala]
MTQYSTQHFTSNNSDRSFGVFNPSVASTAFSDSSGVPRGTVEGRRHQLDRGASRSDPLVQQRLRQRDRESQLLGWGQKLGRDACFVRPATHSTSIEVEVEPPSHSSLSSKHRQHSLLDLLYKPATQGLEAIIDMTDKLEVHQGRARSSSRPANKWRASREISAPSLAASLSSIATTPTGRRLAARQLFEQYGISRPSG